MHPNLSFEQAPPISVPYRFFLTAPWFGVAAGGVLTWHGGDALASRWTPGTLAATHLLAVGFMLQAMAGALLQFVPVAAGGNVWRPRLVAGIAHPLLASAAMLLVAAFLKGGSGLFHAAAALFLLVVGGFSLVVGFAVWRTPARGATIQALRIAVPGLAITVGLGASLAVALGAGLAWPLVELANVHAAWGLGGWSLLLLAGVSYYVVPMFQLTPPYPPWLTRWLPPALLAMLAVWSLQLADAAGAWLRGVWMAGLLLAAVFGVVTLQLQMRRRRKVADPTLFFFRGAMLSLVAIPLSAALLLVGPGLAEDPRGPLWLGVLALPGVFVSAINGMLYKIVPFLNWLHLQRQMATMTALPINMKQMIPESAMLGQMWLHFGAVAMLLAAVAWPALTRPAGVLFAASCAWLGWNLIAGIRVYRGFRDRIRAGDAGQGS
jgi:hypothetical protein